MRGRGHARHCRAAAPNARTGMCGPEESVSRTATPRMAAVFKMKERRASLRKRLSSANYKVTAIGAATMTDQSCEEVIKSIRDTRAHHFEQAKKIRAANQAKMCWMDFLAFSALKRSLSLCSGFCQMIEQKNYVCAAPLIRLQIDSCLRFYATSLVNNSEEFAKNVVNGSQINTIKDSHGKELRDSYLVERLSSHIPWIRTVYHGCSGFIHFSEKHFFSTFIVGNETGKLTAIVSEVDNHIDSIHFIGLAQAFLDSTNLLLHLTDQWGTHKETIKPIQHTSSSD